MKIKALGALLLAGFSLAGENPRAAERPLLVTVDDLPMSYGNHEKEESRLRITRGLLAALDKHGVRAVGMATWSNVRTEADLRLLDLWIAAGHELGNHSNRRLDYSTTAEADYIEDIESARRSLADYLERHDRQTRFFRFPYLREGDTPEKLMAMREYLTASGQRNLPVTEHDYVAPRGPGLWDRLLSSQRVDEAKAEIEATLQRQVEAWNRGDLEAFCEIYATDATFLSPSGLTQGRNRVLERYRIRYPNRVAMDRLSLEVIEARPATGIEVSMQGDARPSRVHGMAVAARWRLDYPDKESAEGLTLIILRRRAQGWEIVQDASM